MKALDKFYFHNNDGVIEKYCINTANEVRPAVLEGCKVSSYRDLLQKVGELKFRNKRLNIAFRGQSDDFGSRGIRAGLNASSLYPTIFRNPSSDAKLQGPKLVDAKYRLLDAASAALKVLASEMGGKFAYELINYEPLRLALIQHYEVVDTPYLDLSPNIATAISFGMLGDTEQVYIYAVGLPNQTDVYSGSITERIESIYLPRYCPSSFLRPHLQDGMIVGEFPRVTSYRDRLSIPGVWETRSNYDFRRRLIGKYRISKNDFNQAGFQPIPENFLYPEDDSFLPMVDELNSQISDKKDLLKRAMKENDIDISDL